MDTQDQMQITVPVVPTFYTGWDKSKAFKLPLGKVNLGFETSVWGFL